MIGEPTAADGHASGHDDTLPQTLRPARILGVNDIGLQLGNAATTAARVLPWLQPAADQDIWTLWQVVYRDVVILGPNNEQLGAFNLTEHNLSDPAAYTALKTQLLEAANQ
ncbi:MAG TPA: hypothetical protein VM243_17405 [Phycisphaerae bacterium]|nr:hypothetical protein [Phycisphaerae bacterium]